MNAMEWLHEKIEQKKMTTKELARVLEDSWVDLGSLSPEKALFGWSILGKFGLADDGYWYTSSQHPQVEEAARNMNFTPAALKWLEDNRGLL